MVLEITGASLAVTATVVGAAAKLVHWLVAREIIRSEKDLAEALERRDQRIEALERAVADKDRELEGAFKAVKDTQKTLFEKLDVHYKEFQEYRLTVAKEYVAVGALKELLAPIASRLDSIEHDLRNQRNN